MFSFPYVLRITNSFTCVSFDLYGTFRLLTLGLKETEVKTYLGRSTQIFPCYNGLS